MRQSSLRSTHFLALTCLVWVIGCATKEPTIDFEAELAKQQQEIQALESKFTATNSALKEKEVELNRKEEAFAKTIEENKAAESLEF